MLLGVVAVVTCYSGKERRETVTSKAGSRVKFCEQLREHSNHNAFIRCCLFLNILQKYISLGNERVERGFSTIEERLKKNYRKD